ncbi:MAG: hypothetical protein JWN44_5925 [Myxococcales bacterium]|nr:hypothetical protein [Myxococcales bacterium]
MTWRYVVGAILVLAPAMALARQDQKQQDQQKPSAMQNDTQSSQTPPAGATVKRILPSDAKLVGATQATEVRTLPEQSATNGTQTSKVQKEALVGVHAVDSVWTTKQPYAKTVNQIDQKLKGEGVEPIVKTITESATAWNMRMPDGHISNVVVRNTQPTTIETVQAAMVAAPADEGQQQPNQYQPRRPSSKMPDDSKMPSNDTTPPK